MARTLSAMILAAGEGKRMVSDRPKPLHLLCGRPLLLHVVDMLAGIGIERVVVVVGHGAERVTKKVQELTPPGMTIDFVEQARRLGTGDAVMTGLTAFIGDQFDDEADLLVLPGDQPLLSTATMRALLDEHVRTNSAATMLTARLADPNGLGRVVRARNGNVARVVEHADATDDERAIDEINTSIYCFRQTLLAPALRRIDTDNAQGEYYLTDVIEVLHDAGHRVSSHVCADPSEALGVNDRVQLAAVEASMRERINRAWLEAGVTMVDPSTTYIDVTVTLDRDVTLFPGTMLQGRTRIGRGCEIGPNTRLVDTSVGAGCRIEATVAREAEIGDDAVIGPFASLAPGARIGSGAWTGPFYTATAGD